LIEGLEVFDEEAWPEIDLKVDRVQWRNGKMYCCLARIGFNNKIISVEVTSKGTTSPTGIES
jgi:hypothetical protein